MKDFLLLACLALTAAKPFFNNGLPPGLTRDDDDEVELGGGLETKVDALAAEVGELIRRVEMLEENIRAGRAEAELRAELESIGFEISNLEIRLSMTSSSDFMFMTVIDRIFDAVKAGLPDGEALERYIIYLARQNLMSEMIDADPDRLFRGEFFPAKKMIPPSTTPPTGIDYVLEGIRGRLRDLKETIGMLVDDRPILLALLRAVADAVEEYFTVTGLGESFAEYVESKIGSNTSSGTTSGSQGTTSGSQGTTPGVTTPEATTPFVGPSTGITARGLFGNVGMNHLSKEKLQNLKKLALQVEAKRLLKDIAKELKLK